MLNPRPFSYKWYTIPLDHHTHFIYTSDMYNSVRICNIQVVYVLTYISETFTIEKRKENMATCGDDACSVKAPSLGRLLSQQERHTDL